MVLGLALAGCGGKPGPVAQASRLTPMITPEKLRDDRIEIATLTCVDHDPCKTYQISINRDGAGDMIFYRDGRREVRRFRMPPFTFRQIQALVEDFRPDPGDTPPVEFEGAMRRLCDHCQFTENTTVHWHRDDGQVREFVIHSTLANDHKLEGLLQAQNDLMEGMLPSLLGHP